MLQQADRRPSFPFRGERPCTSPPGKEKTRRYVEERGAGMNKQELNDRLLDEVIRYAVAELVEEEASRLPSNEELKSIYTPSARLEAKMQKLFKQQRRREQFARIRKTALKAAAVVLVFLAVSFFTIMNVDALRVRFMNYISERGDKSTTIRVNNNDNSYSAEILPTYLPDGYKNVQLEIKSDYYFAVFKNDNGDKIVLRRLGEGTTAGIDTENAYAETITVNGYNAEYYYKDGTGILIYKYKSNVFILTGSIPKDELIKIAESMKYTK